MDVSTLQESWVLCLILRLALFISALQTGKYQALFTSCNLKVTFKGAPITGHEGPEGE